MVDTFSLGAAMRGPQPHRKGLLMATAVQKRSSIATLIVNVLAICLLGPIRPITALADDAAVSEAASDTSASALEAIARARLTDDEPLPSPRLSEIVEAAFRAVHDGWSCDEVLLDDELNKLFLAKCRDLKADADATDCNWTLLNLRKSGKLGAVATKRRRDLNDDYQHAAEIAARFLQDKYKQTIDRLLCNPETRAEFDRVAKAVSPDTELRALRKAALALRKARKLQPEFVTRVADWDREVVSHPAADIVADAKLVPDKPGIYIFRDPTGYLYVGESSSLRFRVNHHLDHSDRKSLAH